MNRLKNLFLNKEYHHITGDHSRIIYETQAPDIPGKGCLTLSVIVCINSEFPGYIAGRSLFLMIESFDKSGNCSKDISRCAPDAVGKWELSVTSKLIYGTDCIRCSFVFGAFAGKDTVVLSDIRITETESMAESFMVPRVRPFTDKDTGNGHVRDYSVPGMISDAEISKYFIFAKAKGYFHDLKQVRENLCARNKKYLFLYDLFVNDDINVFRQKNVLSFIQGLDDRTSDMILEKLALSGDKESLYRMIRARVSHSAYSELMGVFVGCGELSSERLGECAAGIDSDVHIFKKGSFKHFCYADCEDLPTNRWLVKWFDDNYSEIQRRAELLTKAEGISKDELPVFVFWDKGISEAPPVVKKCVGNMRSIFGDRLHVLDSENVKYYARMENCGGISSLAALSDYLRAELLMRYGGTWLDSTLFIKNDFCSIMNEHADIVPTYMPAEKHLGSWLLSVGERYSYFYCLLYSALNMFLYDHKDFKTYYMFHRFWEIICLADEEAALYWKNAYKLNARNALEMWLGREGSLTAPRRDEEFYAFYDLSPVHKLTYKYNENEADFCSNISRMMRMGAENNAQKTKGIQELNGRKYYFDEISGKPVTGLKIASSENGAKKMMLYDKNGRMVSGEYDISGFKLLFGDNGELEAVSEIKS